MPLERWQKYLKNNPCPICGGTTSGSKGSKCKGYLHEDGRHAFCQRKRSAYSLNVQGLVLYKHELGEHKADKPKDSKKVLKGEFLVEEVTNYHGVKFMGLEVPSFSKTFYVFYRDGEEVTRDISPERIRFFAPGQKILTSEEYQSLDPSLHQKS
jgi:hypothetical protein